MQASTRSCNKPMRQWVDTPERELGGWTKVDRLGKREFFPIRGAWASQPHPTPSWRFFAQQPMATSGRASGAGAASCMRLIRFLLLTCFN